jgi:tRNA(Arg) A34 adenosine deaminase TadA
VLAPIVRGKEPLCYDVATAQPSPILDELRRLQCHAGDSGSGEVLARGSNASTGNPILHGEIVAINDYVARYGNRNWSRTTIYTTAEPCSMCASAIVWCAIPRVVYGSSTLVVEAMMDQISVRAAKIFAGAPFYRNSLLLGGVLAAETDTMLRNRVK